MSFFWVGHFDFFSKKNFFLLIPMKISHKLCVRMDGAQFLWLWWFTAKNHSPQTFQPAVYISLQQRFLKNMDLQEYAEYLMVLIQNSPYPINCSWFWNFPLLVNSTNCGYLNKIVQNQLIFVGNTLCCFRVVHFICIWLCASIIFYFCHEYPTIGIHM